MDRNPLDHELLSQDQKQGSRMLDPRLLRRSLRALAVVFMVSLCFFQDGNAQRGFGMRFGTDFNYFFRSQQHPLVDGWWSHMVIGPYYQAYFPDGGAQIGLNFLYKGNTPNSFNLPVIQRDYGDDPNQNVGLTALELDFKVGPRFGIFNPKIGMLLSYWMKRDGFVPVGTTDEVHRMNFQFPIGLSVEGPTGYGSVGFSVFYEIGLTNVLKNPNPTGLEDFDGSKVRALNIELFILFKSGKQAPKVGPSMPPPVD